MLVTNEEAVLKDTSQGPESKPSGLNGWMPWVRRITNSTTKKRALNTSVVRAYDFQSCWRCGSVRSAR